jgi:predicted nucleic-acid-binding Zn-ribbon protein
MAKGIGSICILCGSDSNDRIEVRTAGGRAAAIIYIPKTMYKKIRILREEGRTFWYFVVCPGCGTAKELIIRDVLTGVKTTEVF